MILYFIPQHVVLPRFYNSVCSSIIKLAIKNFRIELIHIKENNVFGIQSNLNNFAKEFYGASNAARLYTSAFKTIPKDYGLGMSKALKAQMDAYKSITPVSKYFEENARALNAIKSFSNTVNVAQFAAIKSLTIPTKDGAISSALAVAHDTLGEFNYGSQLYKALNAFYPAKSLIEQPGLLAATNNIKIKQLDFQNVGIASQLKVNIKPFLNSQNIKLASISNSLLNSLQANPDNSFKRISKMLGHISEVPREESSYKTGDPISSNKQSTNSSNNSSNFDDAKVFVRTSYEQYKNSIGQKIEENPSVEVCAQYILYIFQVMQVLYVVTSDENAQQKFIEIAIDVMGLLLQTIRKGK